MVVAVEQRCLLTPGGLADQPGWFIRLLSWFGPAYDTLKFMSRAKMILGDDGKPRQPQKAAPQRAAPKRR